MTTGSAGLQEDFRLQSVFDNEKKDEIQHW